MKACGHGRPRPEGPSARALIEAHAKHTGSRRAQQILAQWGEYRTRFVKVFPREYRRALGELATARSKEAA